VTATVFVRRDGATQTGRAVDLSGHGIDPATVAAAVTADDIGSGGELVVACPPPSEVHPRVAVISPEREVRTRTALALAARSMGATTPEDGRIEDVRRQLRAIDSESVDLERARRQVAAASDDLDALRERVARLQGRVRERRSAGEDASDIEDRLREAARQLSEVETEHAAARQALTAARDRARDQRDERERRLQLEDRLANLERDARRHLVAEVEAAFRTAVGRVPGGDGTTDPFDADAVSRLLGIARVADLSAPVALACDRFPDVDAASRWLDAPVIGL